MLFNCVSGICLLLLVKQHEEVWCFGSAQTRLVLHTLRAIEKLLLFVQPVVVRHVLDDRVTNAAIGIYDHRRTAVERTGLTSVGESRLPFLSHFRDDIEHDLPAGTNPPR